MSRERDFIACLAAFAHDPAARGLTDDAAVLSLGGRQLVATHDMLVEGVHYLPDDPAEDVAWKLVAVNLSDLAAKGARPLGVLLGYPLARESAWDMAFVGGLRRVLDRFAVPLLGGDTVSVPRGSARQLGLTALGETERAPARSGARDGDLLYVTGLIGAAGLGLHMARDGVAGRPEWLAAYRRPTPRLAEGQALAPRVHAMADISDGLLIDAARMAEASGLSVEIDLERVPCAESAGDRLAAVTAGDDYELLVAARIGLTLPQSGHATLTAVGRFAKGRGLTLVEAGRPVPPPQRLGYEHGTP
ncbi:thiamine-phosphate kinase [uncultured Sphingomonas sp.]|uniref:thiamine-phosphate kinase n=1 Tax=uncultured Sphingomonas sp. TaxID=158754 RepID=UPI0025E7A0DD|nr:thiamine-phosphate kinase [uncultured Sphingomonas sp.]